MKLNANEFSSVEMIDIFAKASHAAMVIAIVLKDSNQTGDILSFATSGDPHRLIISFPGGSVHIYIPEDAEHVVTEIRFRYGGGKEASEVARLLGGNLVEQSDKVSWIVPAQKSL